MKLRKCFGDKTFYRRVLKVALPIVVGNAISHLVSLLDNIMVSSLGTEALAGVSITNEFIFIFQLIIFGTVSAAGIFGAQFHGSGDKDGVVYTTRFKLIATVLCAFAFIGVLWLFGDTLIASFLHENENAGDLALTAEYAREYMRVNMLGFVFFALAQTYASTMRETGETLIPMVSSITSVITNFFGNAVLIYGLCGAPTLGIRGAAIATVLSHFINLLILAIYSHAHSEKCYYANKCYQSIRIPLPLLRQIIIKGVPIMLNEFLWSLAITMRNQSYSTRGLDTVAARTIAANVINLMSVVYKAVGVSISILVGGLLGEGKLEQARDSARRMCMLDILVGLGIGIPMMALSPIVPTLYGATAGVSKIATFMLIVSGLSMPFVCYSHAAYYTMRTGGRVLITVLLDSGWMWAVVVPTAVLLSRFTSVSIFTLYILATLAEALKAVLCAALLRRVNWAQRLVGEAIKDEKDKAEISGNSV